MVKELLIFYLSSNDRYFVFHRLIDEILKSRSKQKIKLLIVNSSDDFDYYKECLLDKDISYEFSNVPCPQSDYIPKVKFAINYAKENNFNYIMKIDNDVLIPSYTFDFIVDNLDKLKNENLTISPTLSTGIPSVEYFIDDFFNKDESESIRNEFKKCVFHIQQGIMDYTKLNDCSINSDIWDYEKYFETLESNIKNMIDIGGGRTPEGYSKYYKGIHPIRHGFGNKLINDLIIKHRDRFFEEKDCLLFQDNKPYLCDMCFIITTENYDKLINIENLTIDGCDEVPLNRFRCNNNMKHLIIKNGFAIHITYNWRWSLNNVNGGSNIDQPNESLIDFEQNFINKLYE